MYSMEKSLINKQWYKFIAGISSSNCLCIVSCVCRGLKQAIAIGICFTISNLSDKLRLSVPYIFRIIGQRRLICLKVLMDRFHRQTAHLICNFMYPMPLLRHFIGVNSL